LTGEIKLNLNINRCFRKNKRRDKSSSVFYIGNSSINVQNIDADISSSNNNFLDGNDFNEYFRNNKENKGNETVFSYMTHQQIVFFRFINEILWT
jgi:O-phosphoseryl-tRNA(Cys) synthetase